MTHDRPAFSVVVPTHGRPDLLHRCLEGLAAQTRPALEIIVARPATDEQSATVVGRHPAVTDVPIAEASNMAGLEAGTAQARGDVVCLIDDDAVPHPDWLERMAAHFGDSTVGAVGGRDRQPGSAPRPGLAVGLISPWGKLIGNHHLGEGAARQVDVLKGVNMAVRRDLLALPVGLRGGGTQDHFEVAMGLWVARNGARVIYDPAVSVDHFPAPRVDGTRRFSVDSPLARASAFNLVYGIVSLRPGIAVRRTLFGLLVGDRGCPGLLRAAMALVQRDRSVYLRLGASLHGQIDALAEIIRGRPLRMRRVFDGSIVTTGRHGDTG